MSLSMKQIIIAMAMLSGVSAFGVKSSNCRREFLKTVVSSSAATIVTVPSIVNASYGDSSNIKLPNYIEFLIEKNKQVDPSAYLLFVVRFRSSAFPPDFSFQRDIFKYIC